MDWKDFRARRGGSRPVGAHDGPDTVTRVSASLTVASASGWESVPSCVAGRTSRSTASVSAATNPACARTAFGDRAVGADRQLDPVGDRQAGVRRALLDDPHHVAAVPSAASATTARSSAISPVLPGSAEVTGRIPGRRPASARTRRGLSLDACCDHALAHLGPATCLDRRDDLLNLAEPLARAAAGSRPARNAPRLAGSAASRSTAFSFTVLAISSVRNGASDSASGWAMTSDASGSRTRSWCALRRPSAVLEMARTRSMAPVSSPSPVSSRAHPARRGKRRHDARCTLGSPVSPYMPR